MGEQPLSGRVALVTGGGRGIGRAICVALAEDGADVAVNYRRDAEAADEVVAEIEKLGRRAIAVGASVDDAEADAAMVARVVDELGSLSIVVNNAGQASRGNAVADTDAGEVAKLLGTHAVGAHHVCRLALPHLRQAERGDVVFISSLETQQYAAHHGPYAMAKAAMEALAFVLAKEELASGIHVNVVAPGLVKTEMGRRLVRAVGVDIDEIDSSMPFKRVCRPEDVADVVRYLVGPGASYLTSQKIVVDGGQGLR
jgi:NAD(P)-dependent dehydrogenase (short-subunit alcohol dehydrogenase family)